MGILFLYGVAGTGKIYVSRYLAAYLNYPLCEANRIREPAIPVMAPEDPKSFRYLEVGYAWARFGKLTPHNALAGLQAVRRSMKPILQNELITLKDGVFEGDYIDPRTACTLGQVILITNLNEAAHRRQFFQYRAHSPSEEASFTACRFIQPYLVEEAAGLPVTVIDCQNNPTAVVDYLTRHILPPMLN